MKLFVWFEHLSSNYFVRSGENMKQVPLVFIVMSGKAKTDYRAVYRILLDQLPTVPAVSIEYHSGFWGRNLAGTVPGIIRCATEGLCFSFYASCVAQESRTWYAEAYNRKTRTYDFCCGLMAILFLPAAYIPSRFATIEATNPPEQLSQLLRYFKQQWMPNSIFPISSWSIFSNGVALRY